MTDRPLPVSVSRRIDAPATVIFGLLADPARHPDIDGSDMLRPGGSTIPVRAVGDMFVMHMYLAPLGDYTVHNHVIEFVPDRLIAWEPAPGDPGPAAVIGVDVGTRPGHVWRFELVPDGPGRTLVTQTYDCANAPERIRTTVREGEMWRRAMTGTLERLDELAT